MKATFGDNYFTERSWQAIGYEMLKPLLERSTLNNSFMKQLQYMSYYVMPDIRSDGRELLQRFSRKRFEEDFRIWLSKHPSHRSKNLLLARVDDSKCGRKYGLKIPEVQYLYDYVKNTKYPTHQLYVLMISLGNMDYIVDFIFEHKDKCGTKIAYQMIDAFIKRLIPDLRLAFKDNVRIALDGAYGNLYSLEELIEEDYSFVVKSGGKQKIILPDGQRMSLKSAETWMIDNLDFKPLGKCHKMDCEYASVIVMIEQSRHPIRLCLYRFKKKRKKGFRYLLLLTNRFDWYAFRILKTYKGRWPIETMFRTTKQKFRLKNYSYHHRTGTRNIKMHFGLCFILYMTINRYRQLYTRRSQTKLQDVILRFVNGLKELSEKSLLILFSGKLKGELP